MSQRDRLQRPAPGAPNLSPVIEHPDSPTFGPFHRNLRANAVTFRPGSRSAAPRAFANTFVEPPPSPDYDPPVTPFKVDSPSMQSTAPSNTVAGLSEHILSASRTFGNGSSSASFPSANTSTQDLKSLWSDQPAKFRSSPDSNEDFEPDHYRSGARDIANYDKTSTHSTGRPMTPKFTSSHSSSLSTSTVASPSPHKPIYATKGINEQTWSLAPGPSPSMDQASMVKVHPSGSPEHTGARTRWSMPPVYSGYTYDPAGPSSTARLQSHRTTASFDQGGRDTTGGVALPGAPGLGGRDFLVERMQGLHVNTDVQPRQQQQTFNDQSETAHGAQELSQPHFTASQRHSMLSRDGDDSYNASPTAYGSPEGTQSRQSSVTTPSPSPNAKVLADFIKSGGAESPQTQGHHSPYSTPRYRPPMLQQQQQQQEPSYYGRATPGPPPPGFAVPAPQTYLHDDPMVEGWKAAGGPSWEVLADNIPLFERMMTHPSCHYGVVKIADIPFAVTKPEIVALIGEKARMAAMPRGSGSYAIHIMMERATAKSNDCYVEFETHDDAYNEACRLQSTKRLLGNRRARIAISSQNELMAEMFPRAKCVQWHGCEPEVVANTDPYSDGYQGFVTSEEMHHTSRIATVPSRYQFTHKHPQRTYESMISLMVKYPWSHTNLYTLAERNRIFKTVSEQIGALVDHLKRRGSTAPLDFTLLNDLLDAGLKCPGFSERQRAELIDVSEGLVGLREYVTPFSKDWPFEALAARGGSESTDLVLYVLDLLRSTVKPTSGTTTPQRGYNNTEQTGKTTQILSLAQISRQRSSAVTPSPAPRPIQNSVFAVDYPPNKDDMTMAQIVALEFQAVEDALKSILQ